MIKQDKTKVEILKKQVEILVLKKERLDDQIKILQEKIERLTHQD